MWTNLTNNTYTIVNTGGQVLKQEQSVSYQMMLKNAKNALNDLGVVLEKETRNRNSDNGTKRSSVSLSAKSN